MLLLQLIRRAASRAACTAGNNNPTKIPIIAMTTSNSTSVNAVRRDAFFMGTSVSAKKQRKDETRTGIFPQLSFNLRKPETRVQHIGEKNPFRTELGVNTLPWGGVALMPKRDDQTALHTPKTRVIGYWPSTYAKIRGATMVASLAIMNLGLSGSSLFQVIFSFGTAPLYPP